MTPVYFLMETEKFNEKIRAYYNGEIENINDDWTTYGLILRCKLMNESIDDDMAIADASEPDSAEYDAFRNRAYDTAREIESLIRILEERGIDASALLPRME